VSNNNSNFGRDYGGNNYGRDYGGTNFGRDYGGTNFGRDYAVPNYGRDFQATAVVPVVSAPVVLPASASVAASGTQQFIADIAVSWSVVSGGGSISGGGLYTAPSAPATVTIRATATADATKHTDVTVTVLAAYWMDSAYDSRLPVSATNSSGATLYDHLLAVTVPVGVSIDTNSLRAVETTTLGSIDRAYDWRYATGSTSVNNLPFLPVVVSGGVAYIKTLGRWTTAETRTFHLYWNAAGGIAAASYNHLNAIAPGWTAVAIAGTTGDTYRLVVNGTNYTYTMLGGDTATTIATALKNLINAGTDATATSSTGTITITRASLTNVSFTVTSTGTTTPANLVVTKPLFWTLGRTGPDVAAFAAATYAFGMPYGISSGVATRPCFGHASSLGVRTMQYRVNGDATAYGTTDATITSFSADGPRNTVAGALTFSTRAAAVDWAGTYTATHENRIVAGRKSDDTGAATLNKLVDAVHVVLTYTCQRTYAPTTVLSSVTSTSNQDFLTLGSTVNVFTSNVTEAAGNKIANFSAPVSTGVITSFAASANLSALPVVGTILGTHGNTGAMGVLVNSISFANWTANPTPHWAANSNPFAILQMVNLSNAVSIPAGATVTIDFWIVRGYTNNATTTGDNLLPDELVTVMQQIAYAPTVTASAVETYSSGSLAATMALAGSRAVDGVAYIQDNALTFTTVARGYTFQRHAQTGVLAQPDDDDGSYGNGFATAGLCLRYLRTHDSTLIARIENQIQYHLDIEAAAVAAYGSFWSGSVPYWYSAVASYNALLEGGCTEWNAATNNDPTLIDPAWTASHGVAELAPITYALGQVRRKTSIDQMNHVAMGLYHYLYLLRNEAAITANTTLRTNALSLLSRMATFEAAHYTASARVCGNLYDLVSGGTPSRTNGVTTGFTNSAAGTVMAVPYYPGIFLQWQVNNGTNLQYSPSANTALMDFFRAVYAPNSVNSAVVELMRGWGANMLTANYGYHDVTAGATTVGTGVQGSYLPGWHGRPNAPGNTVQYASPRTVASNNGFSSDLHFFDTNSGGARDHLNGRGAHRACALAIAALLDPSYALPVEMNGATVLRSVPIQTALNNDMRTMANYLLEPTTKMNRLAVAGYFGKTTTYDPQIVDSAYTGYWMMAVELWYLVQARVAGTINPADYYVFAGV
jgi:hypothetical protein